MFLLTLAIFFIFNLSSETSQHLLDGLTQNFYTDIYGSQRMNGDFFSSATIRYTFEVLSEVSRQLLNGLP